MSDAEREVSDQCREREGDETRSGTKIDDSKGMSSPPLTHKKGQRADSADREAGQMAEGEQSGDPRPSGLTVHSTTPTELGAGSNRFWGGPAPP